MITSCKFTLDEIKKLSKSMLVLVDSREKENRHILDYFDKNGIRYRKVKLDYGDYSFMLPSPSQEDIYFHREIVIERKSGLEELSGNLGKERDRFEREMLRACKDGCKVYLLVENPRGYNAIMEHDYHTEFKPLQYVTSLKSFENKYNLNIQFIDKRYAGYIIYSTFYYFMRERLT